MSQVQKAKDRRAPSVILSFARCCPTKKSVCVSLSQHRDVDQSIRTVYLAAHRLSTGEDSHQWIPNIGRKFCEVLLRCVGPPGQEQQSSSLSLVKYYPIYP